jgi:hypothetical protein
LFAIPGRHSHTVGCATGSCPDSDLVARLEAVDGDAAVEPLDAVAVGPDPDDPDPDEQALSNRNAARARATMMVRERGTGPS